jgi:syntaxin 5
MTGKDRTLEFQKISESLKAQNGPAKALARPINHSLLAVRALASEISKETAETALKLKELTKLAKTKSPFGDPTSKIDEYTYTIKQDITVLQQKIQKLEQIVNGDNAPNKQTEKHSTTIVNALNTNLLETTKKFGETLKLRTTNLKEQEERRERVTGHRALTPFKFQPAFDNFDEEKLVSSNGSDIVIKMSPMLQTYDNESLVLQRVDQVRDIEIEINQVQQIFSKLAELVQIHGEKIRRIEESMDETLGYAEDSHRNLLDVYTNLSSNRRLILKSFGVVMFFIMVWILFFA